VCVSICALQYFRAFASVPPPSISASPLPHNLQPILPLAPHQNNCRPSSTSASSFQTNVRPPTGAQNISARVVTEENSSTIKRQQQQQQQPWSTDTSVNNNNAAMSSLSHSRHVTSVTPEVALLCRKVTDQSVVKRFTGTGARRQIDNEPRPTSGLKFEDCKIEQNMSAQMSVKQPVDNEELSTTQLDQASETLIHHDVRSSTWDRIQAVETEPRSPADSGWMSDVSASTSNNGVNDEGEGHSESSFSSLPIDAEDDEETVDNIRVDDHLKSRKESTVQEDRELSSDDNATGCLKPSKQLVDELGKFRLLDSGRGRLESPEGGGQSGGEGDDEDSLFSLSVTTLEEKKPAKNETAVTVRSTTDIDHGTTTRQGRVMRTIPIRFQRLLEAEVQRVAAMRRRVEGPPLFAADKPSDGQHPMMAGCLNGAKETLQTSASPVGNVNMYPPMFSASPVSAPYTGYQLPYHSDQVTHGVVPSSYFIPDTPTSGELSSMTAVQFQQQPPAAFSYYQPVETFYNGSYFQPYYQACPSAPPTYVVYVDSATPTMIEDQPSFRSTTSYDHQLRTPPSTVSVVPSCSTSNAAISCNSNYVTGATPYGMTSSVVDYTSGTSVYHTNPQLVVAPHGNAAPATTGKLIPQPQLNKPTAV